MCYDSVILTCDVFLGRRILIFKWKTCASEPSCPHYASASPWRRVMWKWRTVVNGSRSVMPTGTILTAESSVACSASRARGDTTPESTGEQTRTGTGSSECSGVDATMFVSLTPPPVWQMVSSDLFSFHSCFHFFKLGIKWMCESYFLSIRLQEGFILKDLRVHC